MSDLSLGRPTVLLLAGRALSYALGFATTVIIARLLGATDLGAFAYPMGFVALFALLPNLGISTIVTRTIARDPASGVGVFRTALLAQSLLAAGVFILILSVGALLPAQPVPLSYIALAAAQFAIGTLSWPYLAALAGWARYDRVAVAEVAASAIGNVSMLTVAAFHGGVPAFLWAQVIAVCGAVLASRQAAISLLRCQETPRVPLATLFREATPLASSTAIQSLYTRLDIVMLGQFSPGAAVGLYSVAYKPVNMAVFFGATIGGAILPVMAQTRQGEMPAAFARAMRALGVAAPAMALTATGLAEPLLRLLFGSEYAPAAPILGILAWSAAANWLYTPLAISLQARGQERYWLVALLAGLCLNAAGNLWAIPKWGGVGAATATLVSEVALLGLGAFFMRRQLSISPHWRAVAPLLCAATVGACCLGTLRLFAFGPVIATLAALCLYGILLVGLSVIRREDMAMIAGWTRQAVFGETRA